MTQIIVVTDNNKYIAKLFYSNKKTKCLVGFSGIGIKKREGDGITPRGIFLFNSIYYRHDKVKKPKTSLKCIKLKKNYGWSSDSKDPNYNKIVRTPYKFIHEKLYRKDSLYDIIIPISYNENGIKKYKGSAIFLHCSDSKKKYTEGCIALEKDTLIDLVKFLSPSSKLIIR